ncbi:uncharacterized protein LOC122510810 [Leptopilina heterotoma]|uniref:uncharacterized protein LOC122510810 n=1 Tax=Leptopilina heterotoma TaxID=63436 RepID=UPI001CA7D94F|nr:uncharacterized protein LOC122510810 [Leptopilina heterotoma]
MCKQNLKEQRNNYEILRKESCDTAKSWNIEPIFKDKRQYKPKKKVDEIILNYLFSSREHYFKVNIYYKVFDIVINQITNRFEGMEKIVDQFSFLNPNILTSISEESLVKSAEVLKESYPNDLSPAFPLEVLTLCRPLKDEIKEIEDIRSFAHFLIVENNTLASNFPEVITALLIFLTIPVTSASSERSFSK